MIVQEPTIDVSYRRPPAIASTGNESAIPLLCVLLVVSSPLGPFAGVIGSIYLLFLAFSRRVQLDVLPLFFVLAILIANLSFSLLLNGPMSALNALLSLVFYAPLLFFLVCIPNLPAVDLSAAARKRLIEYYLWIQIAFSGVTAFYFNFFGGRSSLEVNFGDVVAGTFRTPLTFTADSATRVFAITLVLVLFLYVTAYGRRVNKFLLVSGLFISFLGSVTHLILAALAGLLASLALRSPVKAATILLTVLALFLALQPANLDRTERRMSFVAETLTSESGLRLLGEKGQFVANYLRDVRESPFIFSFTGAGMGEYSSRAAMYLSGQFVPLPVQSVSRWMRDNTLPLHNELKSKPNFQQGAFYYPYNSLISLLAEFGFVSAAVLLFIFWVRVRQLRFLDSRSRRFLFVFLGIAAMVDHYLEFSQAWFVFVLLAWLLTSPPRPSRRQGTLEPGGLRDDPAIPATSDPGRRDCPA